ncbi:signal peptidase I [Candidatus Gottesmanbacteria bacterium RIFCSPHIGHO2_02_FULL_40_13]|uniref:Signal peptidase I n=1 Tax=Candidatus Gottesmanbacteria bacterium RIFCSPHIGHO2_02_FULL_40_13 TaxID=1798384 RepID=A0A1F6A6C9_9BACT|nr:MAG: signal peptidase I [Candidatus Gottesmanbacteria bacterium RIFCSPHIGHO2_02_FULL_40_13]
MAKVSFWKKFIAPVFTLLIVIIVIASYPLYRQLLLQTGLIKQGIQIAGTGSMFPTFPKGTSADEVINAKEIVAWPKMKVFPSGFNLFGINFFSYGLQRGDIVEIENIKTEEITKVKYNEVAGFVKRVIGLSGDKIELRDGYVYLNSNILDEPYTAKPRSTYGGDFLPDCKVLTVPPQKIFVMGDNRKASLDSRFDLGLIDEKDIHLVIPIDQQEEYKTTLRDTKFDRTLAHKPTLDGYDFVSLLNAKRKEKNIKPLTYSPLLTLSSGRRGRVMIDTDDFSFEATKSGITMKIAVKEAGYQNKLLAEISTRGYFESSELLENFLEFPDTKKLLFSSEYQDIGINGVIGEIQGCPLQVVAVHFGGYVPPNYPKDVVDGWQKLLDNLNEASSFYEKFKNSDGIDQKKISELLNAIDLRRSHVQKVVVRMKANQWLTDGEQKYVDEDKANSDKIQTLIESLSH